MNNLVNDACLIPFLVVVFILAYFVVILPIAIILGNFCSMSHEKDDDLEEKQDE